ncbi:MAG: hypothetical protein ABSB23_00600 [Bryobacteraceae bacterium]|jgi:hypothetical protein
MSSTTQEQLLRFFAEAAGTDVSGMPAANAIAGSTSGVLADAAASVALGPTGDAADSQSYAATPVGTSTRAGAESPAQTSGGTGSTIESAVTTFLEGGLGIVPLVSGLMGLFGGGNSAPPQLEKYQQPSSIDFVSADTPNGLAGADYDQLGMPRLADTAVGTTTTASTSGGGGSSAAAAGSGAGQSGTASPQVTVNVQAMDAQSILDRSGDIAQAVRSAMLNMSTINDVINDL